MIRWIKNNWIEAAIVFCLIGVIVCLLLPFAARAFSEPVTKTVIAKSNEVEGYTSGYAGKDGGGIYGSTYTEWFIVAEDGSTCNVSRGDWHLIKVGDSYTSKWWMK